MATKISVSLSEADLAALDAYIGAERLPGRSAGVQAAIRMLLAADLERDYAAAFADTEESGAVDGWNVTSGDGVA